MIHFNVKRSCFVYSKWLISNRFPHRRYVCTSCFPHLSYSPDYQFAGSLLFKCLNLVQHALTQIQTFVALSFSKTLRAFIPKILSHSGVQDKKRISVYALWAHLQIPKQRRRVRDVTQCAFPIRTVIGLLNKCDFVFDRTFSRK